jgi:hypothetical protein
MAVMLIARFDGDVDQLRQAYDSAHALIMSRGGATGAGELRHHCAIGDGALYIIGVWESEERVRTRWASGEFEAVLTSTAAATSHNASRVSDSSGPVTWSSMRSRSSAVRRKRPWRFERSLSAVGPSAARPSP